MKVEFYDFVVEVTNENEANQLVEKLDTLLKSMTVSSDKYIFNYREVK